MGCFEYFLCSFDHNWKDCKFEINWVLKSTDCSVLRLENMLLRCLVDVTMGVFHGYQIALELSSFSPLKKKQELRRLITSNDGVISFIVTKKVNDADHFLSEFLVCLHCVWPITLEPSTIQPIAWASSLFSAFLCKLLESLCNLDLVFVWLEAPQRTERSFLNRCYINHHWQGDIIHV